MCVCGAVNGRFSVFASGVLDFTLQTTGTIPVEFLPAADSSPYPPAHTHTHTHTHTPLFYSLFPVSGSRPEVLQLFLHLHVCAGISTQTHRLRLSPLLQRQVQCVFISCVLAV